MAIFFFRKHSLLILTLFLFCGCGLINPVTSKSSNSPNPAMKDQMIDNEAEGTLNSLDDESEISEAGIEQPQLDSLDYSHASVVLLSEKQYLNSLHQVFGLDDLPEVVLPELSGVGAKFKSISSSSVKVTPTYVRSYWDTAMQLANFIFTKKSDIPSLANCAPKTTNDPCIKESIESMGKQLFRRPLLQGEVERYVSIATSQGNDKLESGLKYAIAAILQSPNILYQEFLGEKQEDGTYKLNGFEMASRLSLLIWESAPDEALLALAEQGQLDTVEGITNAVTTMLADSKATFLAERFLGQSWNVAKLDLNYINVNLYPDWEENYPLFVKEFRLFLKDLYFTNDEDFRGIFTKDSSFINNSLASVYGLELAIADNKFKKTKLPQYQSGLLTSGAVVAANSASKYSNPVHRGLFVLGDILCITLPATPANLDQIVAEAEFDDSQTVRERVELIGNDPNCMGCHRNFDPQGMLFEHFDSDGKYRLEAAQNGKIDALSIINGKTYNSAAEFALDIANDERALQCLAKDIYSFVLGQELSSHNKALNDKALTDFKNSEFKLKKFITHIATQDVFRFVKQEGE